MISPVMGPEAFFDLRCEFSPTVPPRLIDRVNYVSYRENVGTWRPLTPLPYKKHGPAIVERLHGEARRTAMTVTIKNICSDDGADLIIAALDRLFEFDKSLNLPAVAHRHLKNVINDTQPRASCVDSETHPRPKNSEHDHKYSRRIRNYSSHRESSHSTSRRTGRCYYSIRPHSPPRIRKSNMCYYSVRPSTH